MRSSRTEQRQSATRTRFRQPRLKVELLEDRTLMDAGGSTVIGLDSLRIDPTSYDSTRILVQFRDEVNPIGMAPALAGTKLGRSVMGNIYTVELGAGVSVSQAVQAYSANPNVAFAGPDFTVRVDVIPNDPQFGSLYGLHNTGQAGGTPDADIDAPEAWNITTGTGTVIVAVIDTGVDYTHPDLAANMWTNPGEIANNGIDDDGNGYIDDVRGWDWYNNDNNPMDDHGHGTHVAGTIGAVGNNSVGVVGVAWNVKMMALKFLGASGSGSTSGALSALNYAVANGAHISNNSWGGGGYSSAFYTALVNAANAGHIFVAAAGNSNTNNDTSPHYPSNYDVANVVSVASTTRTDSRSSFSNYGATTVDLGAPGSSITSTWLNGAYNTISGTSMATPHVAGAMALVRGLRPTWTYSQVINTVLSNVDPISSMNGVTVTGGRLNVHKAVQAADPGGDSSGPRITASSPGGTVNGPVSSVSVTFNEAVTGFGTDDITFTGPNGSIAIDSITGSGAKYTIHFASQVAGGNYTMIIGPDIYDLASPPNKMDQDADGIPGEPIDDRYTAAFTIRGTTTFNSTDVPKAIQDRKTVSSILTINQDVMISDINVHFYITHTWDADLRIRLRAPWGTTINLVQYRGGSGDNFGNETTDTLIDDEASTSIAHGSAPFVGTYRPEANNYLAIYDGRNARGTWTLQIYDRATLDVGTLHRWGLTIADGSSGGSGGAGGAGGARSFTGADPVESGTTLLLPTTRPTLAGITQKSGSPTKQVVVTPATPADVVVADRVFAAAAATARRRAASTPTALEFRAPNLDIG